MYQQGDGSLLLIASSERKSQPGRSAQAALDAEEGGREGRREREEKKKNPKKNFFFPLLVTKAVHIWVGPDQAI